MIVSPYCCVVLKCVAFEFDRVEVFLFPMWMIPRLFRPWLKPQLRHLTFLQAPLLFDACMLMDRSTIETGKQKYMRLSSIHTLRTDFYLRKNTKRTSCYTEANYGQRFCIQRHDSRDVHTVFFSLFSRDYAFAINIFLLLLECMHFQDRS